MQQAEHITESEVDIEKKKQELYSEIDALGIKSDSRINKLKKFLADRKIWHMEVYGDWSFVAAEYVEPADISSKLDNINKIKEDLDKYAVELHKVRKSGFTFFEMINQYENYAECEDIKLEGLRDVTEIDRIEFEKMERNVERLIVAGNFTHSRQ